MGAEQEDLEFLKQKVRDAVVDNLKTIQSDKIDHDAAQKEIIEFVFRDVDPKSASLDHARYDWYYTLLGKTIAVTQGWKINQVPELKSKSETAASVRDYLSKTYGQKL